MGACVPESELCLNLRGHLAPMQSAAHGVFRFSSDCSPWPGPACCRLPQKKRRGECCGSSCPQIPGRCPCTSKALQPDLDFCGRLTAQGPVSLASLPSDHSPSIAASAGVSAIWRSPPDLFCYFPLRDMPEFLSSLAGSLYARVAILERPAGTR